MTMVNIVIIGVVTAILAGAAGYVYKEKKRGRKCIGCSGGCSTCCGCDGKSMDQ